MTPKINYRKANQSDAVRLAEMRTEFLQEVGQAYNPRDIKVLTAQLYDYFKSNLENENLIVWLAEFEEEIIATSAMVIWYPIPSFSNMKNNGRGYILNMYTLKKFRHQGIASELLQKLKCTAKKLNLDKVHLHATESGVPLYKKEGFLSKGFPELEFRTNDLTYNLER